MKYALIVLSLLVATASAALAQSAFYYYDLAGNPIYLNPIDTLVGVRFAEGSQGSAQDFAVQQHVLSDDLTFTFVGNRTFVYRIEGNYSLATAMAALRFDEDVAMVNPVAQNRFGERWTMNNRILVTYLQTTTQAQVDSLQSAHGLDLAEIIDDSLKIVVLEYNSATMDDITAICRSYYQSGLCLAVEPEIASRSHPATNDPLYPHQWQLENTGQEGGTYDADVDWPEARRYDTANWVPHIIAVIDAGFQLDHEDLQSTPFLLEYDGAGFFYGDNRPDSNAINDCNGADVECWHGTAVLGIIAANMNNGFGITGAEPRARIMPIKVADASGKVTQTTITRGLSWAFRAHGPVHSDLTCMTQNFPDYQSPNIEYLLQTSYNAGRPIVCSAGNYGMVDYPANLPYVLAVGMTNFNEGLGEGSGAGPELDVVAPGWDVWSLDLMGNDGRSPGVSCDGNPNYTCHLTGTSFSAPLVTAIIARLLSSNPYFMGPQQNPPSAEVIYNILRVTADREPYGGGSGRVNNFVGWGRVNADEAVAAANHGDANNSGAISISDAVYLIQYIFAGGPAPIPNIRTGDADCNGAISISDAVKIVMHVFAGGSAPRICPF